MDAAGWEPRVALAVSLVSLGVSLWTMWASNRRLALLDLHRKLVQLAQAALEHLRVQVGEYPTEKDVWGLRKDAAFAVGRAPWEDVRLTAQRVLERCEAVLAERVREAPIERKDEIGRAIEDALDAASETIGDRVDALGSARSLVGAPWRRIRR